MTPEEQWRPIRGWHPYEISDLGRVRRGAMFSERGRFLKERLLKVRGHGKKYQRVDLFRGGRRWSPLVHCLIGDKK